MNGSPPLNDDPLDNIDRIRGELASITDEPEDTGQFDVSKEGLRVKGIPPWATGFGVLGLLMLLGFVSWLKWGH